MFKVILPILMYVVMQSFVLNKVIILVYSGILSAHVLERSAVSKDNVLAPESIGCVPVCFLKRTCNAINVSL